MTTDDMRAKKVNPRSKSDISYDLSEKPEIDISIRKGRKISISGLIAYLG
jgi:hypothetical protein